MELLAHIDQETANKHTLSAHSQAVGRLCAEFCAAIGLEKLGLLTGQLHDSGKASAAFQAYLRHPKPELRGTINHSYCGGRWLSENLGIDRSASGLAAELAALSICGHHSGLSDCITPTGEDGLHARIYPKEHPDYAETIHDFLSQCLIKLDPHALSADLAAEMQGFVEKIKALCQALPHDTRASQLNLFLGLTARYLESALMDADRYDTHNFNQGKAGAEEEADDVDWKRLSDALEQTLAAPRFQEDSPIAHARREISAHCLAFATQPAGIYQLNVPTGGGKTLASLRYAVHAAAHNGFRRIFYIAPFKTILEQNAQVIRDALGQSELVLEHHGDALPDLADGEDERRYSMLTERWNSPVVLTTMVQFLQTLFSGKSASVRRFHALSGAVILIDEVQSLPPRFISLLNGALNYLSGICGASVILCTATQPTLARVVHPVRLGTPAEMVPALPSFEAFKRTQITDLTSQPPMDSQALAALVLEQFHKTGSVLAVCNTKSAAQKLYRAARALSGECGEAVYYLSAALCPAHRMARLDAIRAALTAPKPVICISTQLIEAGVDISFGCVIRSLAGLDSIAQSAGRCNRNGEMQTGTVLVVQNADEDLSKLSEIRAAQLAAESTLEAIRQQPQRFADGILSAAAIDFYYQKYYYSDEKQLDYPLLPAQEPRLPKETTLLDLLTFNTIGRGSMQEKEVPEPSRYLNQAFQTAGEHATVIESTGVDVLVPYGKGASLIAQLEACSYGQTARLLRQLQRYQIHLFPYEQRILEERGGLRPLRDTGVLVLEPEFYDEEHMGLLLERREMESLIF